MENQLSANSNELSLLLAKLTESQVITNNTISNINTRLSSVEETLQKEVFVTNPQRSEIKKHIKSRVADFCYSVGYEYKNSANVLFKAIYNDINNQYCVTSYHELPRAYYKEIIEKIACWIPTENILRRINK